jgi:hypothetical protein
VSVPRRSSSRKRLAEREGFEPPESLRPHLISSLPEVQPPRQAAYRAEGNQALAGRRVRRLCGLLSRWHPRMHPRSRPVATPRRRRDPSACGARSGRPNGGALRPRPHPSGAPRGARGMASRRRRRNSPREGQSGTPPVTDHLKPPKFTAGLMPHKDWSQVIRLGPTWREHLTRAAGKGGAASGAVRTASRQKEWDKWVEQAKRLRASHPDWSATSICAVIGRTFKVKSETVRKRFNRMDLKP